MEACCTCPPDTHGGHGRLLVHLVDSWLGRRCHTLQAQLDWAKLWGAVGWDSHGS